MMIPCVGEIAKPICGCRIRKGTARHPVVLSSIFFPLWDLERKIIVLDSYFDESGKDDSPVLIISGFVGDSRAMHKLAGDWKALLGNDNVEYWHTKNFRNGNHGLFSHLSESRKTSLVKGLISAINNRALMG